MNIQQLEYILALEEHRHFAKAAEACNVTQPTLSTMIQRLEDELKIKIFDRSHQPIIPTDIGKKVLRQSALAMHEIRRIGEIITNDRTTGEGHIRLALLPTIAPFLWPRLCDLLLQYLPKVSFSVCELQTSECIAALLKDEIDLAIMATRPETDGLCDEFLFCDEFLGYISQNEPLFGESKIRSSEVDGKRLWLLDEGHCFRDQLERFCQLKSFRERSETYTHGSMLTFMRLVEEGKGMTFIPEMAVDTLNPEQYKFVRRFALPRPTREIRIAYREDFIRTGILEKIKEATRSVPPDSRLRLNSGQTVV